MTARVSAPERVAAAYDAIAPRYDEMVREDHWMRQLLWRRLVQMVEPGARVLELGCGTGLDTLALARRGLRVVALDLSPEMIARLARKAEGAGLEGCIEARVGDVGTLEAAPEDGFDAVFSTFAALNTVADPASVAAAAARRLRSGGKMLVHLLAPAGAGHRHHDQTGEHTATISGWRVRHWVLPTAEVVAFFAPHFTLRRCYGLGFLWPRWAGAVLPPWLSRGLGHLEPLLGRWEPFRSRGRFLVLELEVREGER